MRYLAIDLGAESGRGVVGTLSDGRLELHEVHRFPNLPVRLLDGLHWDVLGLYTQIKQAIGLAARESPEPLRGIGIDSWGVDYGLLTSDGSLVGLPYHYRDGRTDGVMERAFAIVPQSEIFRQTGIQFLQFNTLFQLLATKERQPRLLEAAERLLMMGELFTYLLTGRAVGEFTNATTSQLYDPRLKGWASDLFRRFGLPQEIMPEVVPPGTVVGELLRSVAQETGAG
ncbi:MAG TPA: FGGY family carbohydrate kinase, partial [Limnochordia bacterium]|nr:FGGY family carbohydrate kinase [Limnochordia bacterium]